MPANLILIAITLFGPAAQDAKDEKIPTLQQIREHWKARQDRVQSGLFNITETKTTVKGSWGVAPIMPPTDLRHHLDLKLTFKADGCMRIDRNGMEWDENQKGLVDAQYVSLFNGRESIVFFGPRKENTQNVAFVGKAKKGMDFCNDALMPVLICYCSQHPEMIKALEPDIWKVSAHVSSIEGQKCIILEKEHRENKYSYWLDLANDYYLRKYLETNRGRVCFQLDVSYKTDVSGFRVPLNWKSVRLNPDNGEPFVSSDFAVTSYELNVATKPEDFDFQFPVETRINDIDTGSLYIVRPDFSHRLVTKQEIQRGLTAKQILANDDWFAKYKWSFVFGGFILVAAFLLVRRRYRRYTSLT